MVAIAERVVEVGRRMRALAALATVVGVGCFTHRPTTAELPRNTEVSVEFVSPTTITVLVAATDSVQFAAVTELRGRIARTTPDTVYVRVTRASTTSGSVRWPPRGGVAAIARQQGTLINHRELDAGRTALLGVGMAVAGAALLGLALIISMATIKVG